MSPHMNHEEAHIIPRVFNLYQRFVKYFTSSASQLNKQLYKTAKDEFTLTEDQMKSFE